MKSTFHKFFLMALLGAFLFAMGCASTPVAADDEAQDGQESAQTGSEFGAPTVERRLVDSREIPLGNSATLGDPNAPIVIVEFSSLQCPFCARGAATLEELIAEYDGHVQIVFKHFPLPFQEEAFDASRLAEAAGRQDAFWEMRDGILERISDLGQLGARQLGRELAAELGLDADRLLRDMDDPLIEQRVEADLALGRSLGIRGTPQYFVNGIHITGAQPLRTFEDAMLRVDQARRQLQDAGVPEENHYVATVSAFLKDDAQQETAPEPTEPPPTPEQPFVEVGPDDLVYGETDDFLITIVEFSSLQCPFCARASSTLRQLEQNYPGQIRFVFKHFPLDFQQYSEPASRAVVAAQRQGMGRQMLHGIYDGQPRLGDADFLESLAENLGLDLAQFTADFDADDTRQFVAENAEYGRSLGVQGTPAFFVNGERLTGAQPLEVFEALIDVQLERARQLRDDRGLSGEELYHAIMEDQ